MATMKSMTVLKRIRPDGQDIDWLTCWTSHVHSLILNGQDIAFQLLERDDLSQLHDIMQTV